MDDSVTRIVCVALGGISFTCVVGIVVLAALRVPAPEALGYTATTTVGALAGILVVPRKPANGTNGNHSSGPGGNSGSGT